MQTIHNYKKSKIVVGESIGNLLNYLPEKYHESSVIITDSNVSKFHQTSFPNMPVITIGLTEEIKSQITVDFILSKLLDLGADRHWFLIGIGGGIVCDITGYVASIFMRGIKFGYVPTSLLAQVDASIGGKTGINFKGFKNLIGVFNQPSFVICDFELLHTLPQFELKNGLIEAIKHGIIDSHFLFEFIEFNWTRVLEYDTETISTIVANCIKIKSSIVNRDEFESGERKKLNLGHSYGHAIESLSNLSHGSAVAIGLVYAANFSVNKGYTANDIAERIANLLKSIGMAVTCNISINKITEHMLKDKKRKQNTIDFIFIKDIGKVVVESVEFHELINIQ